MLHTCDSIWQLLFIEGVYSCLFYLSTYLPTYLSLHPSINRIVVVVEPSRAIKEREARYTLDRLSVCCKADKDRQTFTLTFTHVASLEFGYQYQNS